MIRVFLLLLLLCSFDEVNSVNPVHHGTDTEDELSGPGSDEGDCSSGTYAFYSLADVSNNTSCNIIIRISTNLVLSSNILFKGVNNITIIGQGNPTVNCNDIGSVRFVSCNNITIKSVNWERCGSVNNPGIEFNNSSNIAIQNCSFHHSTGKAVSLSKLSGNVSINNCQFTHNKYHKGHGAAIYYTSNHEQSAQLVISNCNFTMNGLTESLVYINNSNDRVDTSLLQNSKFTNNQGVPIYISHATLILNNIVSFKDNKATAGGAIYSSNSIIKFDDKCNVSFYNNSADGSGGAIYQTHSKLFFKLKSTVMFARNSAFYSIDRLRFRNWIKDNKSTSGGAIYSSNSIIKFDEKCNVSFYNNSADGNGGAIYQTHSKIFFKANAAVMFARNKVIFFGQRRVYHKYYSAGGAIYSIQSSLISFEDQLVITFSDNKALFGGALYVDNTDINFHGNNSKRLINASGRRVKAPLEVDDFVMSFGDTLTVTFTGNSARYTGGAILSKDCRITFSGHSTVTFRRNHAVSKGGAIAFISNGINGILFDENSTVLFTENSARYGGAVFVHIGVYTQYNYLQTDSSSKITFHGHSNVKFSSNYARERGGAITCFFDAKFDSPSVTLILFSDHSTVIFSSNSVAGEELEGSGGALAMTLMRGKGLSIIVSFTESSNVEFSNNTAQQGGALFCEGNLLHELVFQGNTNVTFTNNRANEGGALYIFSPSHITFTGSAIVNVYNNEVLQSGGAISLSHNSILWFTGRSAIYVNSNLARQHGGALYFTETAQIFFGENSTAEFCSNTASLSGGAILSLGYCKIWFIGKSTIYFSNNLAKQHGGAISLVINARITFKETCSVMFTNNTAMQQGGAVYLLHNSTVTFEDSCNVSYNNNKALQHGGAVYLALQSIATFQGNSIITFESNRAILSGGALYSFTNRYIHFKERSKVLFNHNIVRQDARWSYSICSYYFICQ